MPPIPPVLADPPWRRAHRPEPAPEPAHAHIVVPRAQASNPAPTSPSAPAQLVWEPGERERFRGKPPVRLAESAEERVFERLLGELDKKQPLRAAEIARLGDEKLGELAAELEPATIDATTMTMLLGRLGDDFATHAVTLVRAAPRERGLFEAALPLRSADLARNAAAIFFEREVPTQAAELAQPPSRSHAEAWMLRHPSAVGAGLAMLAQGGERVAEHERAVARAGLAFVAAHGGMAELRTALADAPLASDGADLLAWLEPFAALAALADRPELAWAIDLAARGMEARATALLQNEPAAAAWIARAKEVDTRKKLDAVPDAVVALPAFFDPAALPHPTLLADGAALPDDAVRALGEMLRFSPLLHPYAGVAQVREACSAESLDAFAFALLCAWHDAGEDPRDVWALESCGKVGGDTCARELAARIRSWARGADPPRYGWDQESHRTIMISQGSRGFAYARTACAVLGAIATDVGRMVLEDLAKTGVQIWLRKEAHQALGDEESEVPQDAVDAPVPTVGLDDDGSATLDFGGRSYRLGFTEGLSPFLVDERGARTDSFPRARKDDDAKKYAAAKERFGTIAKDSKIVARYQTALLASVMCSQKTFTPEQFRERFVKHPLLRHLGRRVVWSASPGDASASTTATFRIAEDGSFADVSDATFDPGKRPITVAHPILMDAETRTAWRTRLTDYELVQPFPQLGRELFVRSAEEIGEHDLARAVGIKASRGRLFQLGRRGWRARWDNPEVTEYTRQLPCGATARFEVSPPVGRSDMRTSDAEVFTIVLAKCSYALDRLPPVDYSELVYDLEQTRSSS